MLAVFDKTEADSGPAAYTGVSVASSNASSFGLRSQHPEADQNGDGGQLVSGRWQF